jgi:hypothetical protein
LEELAPAYTASMGKNAGDFDASCGLLHSLMQSGIICNMKMRYAREKYLRIVMKTVIIRETSG